MVKRYKMSFDLLTNGTYALTDPDGEFVQYSDYRELKKRAEDLANRIQKAQYILLKDKTT